MKSAHGPVVAERRHARDDQRRELLPRARPCPGRAGRARPSAWTRAGRRRSRRARGSARGPSAARDRARSTLAAVVVPEEQRALGTSAGPRRTGRSGASELPPGGSILMTSAPSPASVSPQYSACSSASSMTRMPASGPRVFVSMALSVPRGRPARRTRLDSPRRNGRRRRGPPRRDRPTGAGSSVEVTERIDAADQQGRGLVLHPQVLHVGRDVADGQTDPASRRPVRLERCRQSVWCSENSPACSGACTAGASSMAPTTAWPARFTLAATTPARWGCCPCGDCPAGTPCSRSRPWHR